MHDAWVRVPFHREIWISPDGSGRIAERNEPLAFPSEHERADWIRVGQPQVPAVNQTFPAGGLAYVRLDSVPFEPEILASQLADGGATPAEVVRRIGTLITETVPPRELLVALTGAARRVSGVHVDQTEEVVTISGSANDAEGSVDTLTLSLAPPAMVSEQRVAQGPIASLDAPGPIVVLDRRITLSELVLTFP